MIRCLLAVAWCARAFAVVPVKAADGPTTRASRVGFFTTDDGQTWFADSLRKLPPFEINGREAVQAFIFKAGAREAFVGYLQKYTPEAKEVLEKHAGDAQMPPEDAQIVLEGTMVKRPGDVKWLPISQAGDRITVMTPDGKPANSVLP